MVISHRSRLRRAAIAQSDAHTARFFTYTVIDDASSLAEARHDFSKEVQFDRTGTLLGAADRVLVTAN